MQSAKRISLAKIWRLQSSYVIRSYVTPSSTLFKDENNDKNNEDNKNSNKTNAGNDLVNVDKISKQNELIRILNQTAKDKNMVITGSAGNVTGGNGSEGPPVNITNNNGTSANGSGSGSSKTFHCPKCGAVCTHVDSLVSLSR